MLEGSDFLPCFAEQQPQRGVNTSHMPESPGHPPTLRIGPERNQYIYTALKIIRNDAPIFVCERNQESRASVQNEPDHVYRLYLWRMKNGHWMASEKAPCHTWQTVRPAFMTKHSLSKNFYMHPLQQDFERFQFGSAAAMSFPCIILHTGDHEWWRSGGWRRAAESPDGIACYEPPDLDVAMFTQRPGQGNRRCLDPAVLTPPRLAD